MNTWMAPVAMLVFAGCAPEANAPKFAGKRVEVELPKSEEASSPVEIAGASLACVPDDGKGEFEDADSTLACGYVLKDGSDLTGRYEVEELVAATDNGTEDRYAYSSFSNRESVFKYRFMVPLQKLAGYKSLSLPMTGVTTKKPIDVQAVDAKLVEDARRENEEFVKFAGPVVTANKCTDRLVFAGNAGSCFALDVRNIFYLFAEQDTDCNAANAVEIDAGICRLLNTTNLALVDHDCSGVVEAGEIAYVRSGVSCWRLSRK